LKRSFESSAPLIFFECRLILSLEALHLVLGTAQIFRLPAIFVP
jgi:hypothetical protein